MKKASMFYNILLRAYYLSFVLAGHVLLFPFFFIQPIIPIVIASSIFFLFHIILALYGFTPAEQNSFKISDYLNWRYFLTVCALPSYARYGPQLLSSIGSPFVCVFLAVFIFYLFFIFVHGKELKKFWQIIWQ